MRSHARAYETLYSRFDMAERPYGYPKAYVHWRGSQLRRPWREWIKPTDTLLDIGGGYGNQAQHLPVGFDIQLHYVNLDVSETMLKCSDGMTMVGAGETLPFHDEMFDCVTCSEVLEHVSDKEEVLREAYRVLKPNGLFFLSTPRTGWYESLRQGWLGYFLKVVLTVHTAYSGLIDKPMQLDPVGVVDIPSDEKWLGGELGDIGFRVLKQYRADNHLPVGVNALWRWFSDIFVDSQKYGHCVVIICRK